MPEVKDKTTGQVIAKMPYDEAGEMAAEKMVKNNTNLEIDYAPGGTQNAPSMRESYQLGGLIPGQPGFGQRPSPIPNPYNYKKGGKVKKY